jgi:hypothetical protein
LLIFGWHRRPVVSNRDHSTISFSFYADRLPPAPASRTLSDAVRA